MPSTRIDRARQLRRDQTDSEGRLWGELRGRRLGGWKWRRQAPLGPYVVDFYCPSLGLVVELDGAHHQDQADYDERRTRYLGQLGLRVLRFGSEYVFGGGLDHICNTILDACGGPLTGRPLTRPVHLSPRTGRGLLKSEP